MLLKSCSNVQCSVAVGSSVTTSGGMRCGGMKKLRKHAFIARRCCALPPPTPEVRRKRGRSFTQGQSINHGCIFVEAHATIAYRRSTRPQRELLQTIEKHLGWNMASSPLLQRQMQWWNGSSIAPLSRFIGYVHGRSSIARRHIREQDN